MTDARVRAKAIVQAWFQSGQSVDTYPFEEHVERALVEAYNEALEKVLAGIAREQNFREYRCNECGDQDGSAIGACKEIAGYVRALAEQRRKGL